MRKKPFKFIQTLYLNEKTNPYKDSCGWVAPEFHLMSWALSCLQLKRIYGNINLFCNDAAADLLLDDLQLPYNEINTDLNNLSIPDDKLKILPKVFTCSNQTMPFLNIDNDVFVFSKFPPYLLEYKLILENPGMAGGHSYRFFKKNHDAAYLYADNLLNDPEKNSADFNGTTQGYLHLSTETKKDLPTCLAMAAKLCELYPEYYYKIINLFKKKKIEIFTEFYNSKNIDTKADIAVLTEKSRFAFFKNVYLEKDSAVLKKRTRKHVIQKLEDFVTEIFSDKLPESLNEDFENFKTALLSLENTFKISEFYLYGKSLEFQNLFSIFKSCNPRNILLTRILGINIITTSYNYGGILAKKARCGVDYYNKLDVRKKGTYYNLVIPDAFFGCIIYDINEEEKHILELLQKPMTATEIFENMKDIFEEEVLKDCRQECEKYVFSILQSLICKRALVPENLIPENNTQKTVRALKNIVVNNGLKETVYEDIYDGIKPVFEVLDAVSKLDGKTFYIMDYAKHDIIYLSDTHLLDFDITLHEIKNRGYDFFFSMIPPQEHKMLTDLTRSNIEFVENLPENLRTETILSCNFNIIHNGQKWLLNAKKKPLRLTPEGKIWLALFEISYSLETEPGCAEIVCTANQKKWIFDFETSQWNETEQVFLSEIERMILRLSVQGRSIDEISEFLKKTKQDIKFHRGNILKKYKTQKIWVAYYKSQNMF